MIVIVIVICDILMNTNTRAMLPCRNIYNIMSFSYYYIAAAAAAAVDYYIMCWYQYRCQNNNGGL